MKPARIAVMTGASRGIGLALAAALVRRGWDLVIGCRDLPRSQAALESALNGHTGRARFLPLDLASFDSVRAFAAAVGSECACVDLLVNNAGIAHGHGASTRDGHDLVMQTDFLSPFLLTGLLEPLLRASANPGVLCTVSAFQSASGWGSVFRRLPRDPAPRSRGGGVVGGALSYAAAKFALSAFTAEFAARGASWGLRCAAVHPGVVDTGIMYAGGWSDLVVKAIVKPWLADTAAGAANLMRGVGFASGEGTSSVAGSSSGTGNFAYFRGEAQARLPAAALDRIKAGRLWDLAAGITTLTARGW